MLVLDEAGAGAGAGAGAAGVWTSSVSPPIFPPVRDLAAESTTPETALTTPETPVETAFSARRALDGVTGAFSSSTPSKLVRTDNPPPLSGNNTTLWNFLFLRNSFAAQNSIDQFGLFATFLQT